MTSFENLLEKLGVSRRVVIIFAILAAFWIAGWSLLFIPGMRMTLISLAEKVVRRPLNNLFWNEQLLSFARSGSISLLFFILPFFAAALSLNGTRIISSTHEKRLCAGVLAALTAGVVMIIMYHANWLFGDDFCLVTTVAVNRYELPQTGSGRFYPLGHIHDNLPLLILHLLGIQSGSTAWAQYAVIAGCYVLTVMCLWALFSRMKPFASRNNALFPALLVFLFPFTAGAFQLVFMELIFPETVVIMLLALFAFLYYKARETGRTGYYLIAFIVAAYCTYCKEPIFGFFLIIAAAHLLFNFKGQSTREKIFHLALIANGVLFAALYYVVVFKNTEHFYNEGRFEGNILAFIAPLFIKNPVLILMFALGFVRLFFVTVKKDREHLYYDSLLFAGMGYVLAYFVLRMNATYYSTPAVIAALPAFAYWSAQWFETARTRAWLLLVPLLIVCSLNFSFDIFAVKKTFRDRDHFMPYINGLLSEHNSGKTFLWYESDNGYTGNTFYQVGRSWCKIVENSFLNFANKTEGKEFFVTIRSVEHLGGNDVFFYPKANDQYQPMPESLARFLAESGFTLRDDSYDILIFAREF